MVEPACSATRAASPALGVFRRQLGVAATEKSSLIIGAQVFPGSPDGGYALAERIERATILVQDAKSSPKP